MANANDTNFPAGRLPVVFTGDVNSGDSTERILFTIPANCNIVFATLNGYFSAASNATSARLNVGVATAAGGAGNEYLNGWSLVNSQGSNYQTAPTWTRLGAQNSNTWTVGSSNAWSFGSNGIPVSAKVVNSPGAGSGPWQVSFFVIDVP